MGDGSFNRLWFFPRTPSASTFTQMSEIKALFPFVHPRVRSLSRPYRRVKCQSQGCTEGNVWKSILVLLLNSESNHCIKLCFWHSLTQINSCSGRIETSVTPELLTRIFLGLTLYTNSRPPKPCHAADAKERATTHRTTTMQLAQPKYTFVVVERNLLTNIRVSPNIKPLVTTGDVSIWLTINTTWFAPILIVDTAGHPGAVILDLLTHVLDAVAPISTMRIGRSVELWPGVERTGW